MYNFEKKLYFNTFRGYIKIYMFTFSYVGFNSCQRLFLSLFTPFPLGVKVKQVYKIFRHCVSTKIFIIIKVPVSIVSPLLLDPL